MTCDLLLCLHYIDILLQIDIFFCIFCNNLLVLQELDLTKHKLVHDGVLTWNINQRKAVDVHVVLLEDVLVLLQKQDEKLVLKFQSTQLVAGKDDSRYMFSPLLDLSSVLAANSKATGMYKDHL